MLTDAVRRFKELTAIAFIHCAIAAPFGCSGGETRSDGREIGEATTLSTHSRTLSAPPLAKRLEPPVDTLDQSTDGLTKDQSQPVRATQTATSRDGDLILCVGASARRSATETHVSIENAGVGYLAILCVGMSKGTTPPAAIYRGIEILGSCEQDAATGAARKMQLTSSVGSGAWSFAYWTGAGDLLSLIVLGPGVTYDFGDLTGPLDRAEGLTVSAIAASISQDSPTLELIDCTTRIGSPVHRYPEGFTAKMEFAARVRASTVSASAARNPLILPEMYVSSGGDGSTNTTTPEGRVAALLRLANRLQSGPMSDRTMKLAQATLESTRQNTVLLTLCGAAGIGSVRAITFAEIMT